MSRFKQQNNKMSQGMQRKRKHGSFKTPNFLSTEIVSEKDLTVDLVDKEFKTIILIMFKGFRQEKNKGGKTMYKQIYISIKT